ncbi:unnamed protein product [Closterium sp. NIES-53]
MPRQAPLKARYGIALPRPCPSSAPALPLTCVALGFAPSTADPSLFLRTDATLPPFYILVYVDDLVFATADSEALAHVKSELQKRHTCTDLGELTSYLGLRITRDRAQCTITLTQSHMVQQVLQRFGFTYSSPQSTPLPTGHSLSAPPSDESVEPSGPYPELVGCLMYLMTCTRPDLAYPLSLLARYVAPGRHRKGPPQSTAPLVTSPCPARRITLPAVASPCPVRRIALLPARRIAACSSPCPASAELPCSPHRPDASRPAAACPTERSLAGRRPAARALPCWQPHRPARDALLCAALLAGALLPALLCAALLAGALLPARRPAGSQTAARTALPAPPCCCPPCCAPPCPALAARHSSLAVHRLSLPSFATLGDLVTHLCTCVARYRSAHPAEFLDRKPPPPMYITLYFIVTRLRDSLRAVRDHFLALDLTDLTVDLLEKHLLAAETSVVAVGAACGTPRTPFFEGCSPSPLAPSYTSAAAIDILGDEDVGAASSLSGKRCSTKGKGGKSGGSGSGGGGGGGSGGGEGGGGGGSGGSGGGSGGFGGGGGGSSGGGGGGGGGSGSGGGGSGGDRGGAVDIFSLDYNAILAAMYALSVSAEGDCYLCVPPGAGIEAPALSASEYALLGTAPAEALHTFTLDSFTSRCFFRESNTLTPLPALVLVRPADPSRGPVLVHSSTVLPCPAVPSGSLSSLHLPSFSTNLVSTAALHDAMVTTTTPRGHRVSICTCTRTGRHLATFTCWPGSSLYTLTTEPPQVAVSAQVSMSGPVAAPCSCRLLSHQTLLWHQCLGHPSLPRLRGMHSRLLVSGLPKSLPPLPPSPAPPCLLCVEGRKRAAPHSSLFPPTTAPLQTLHMDVWGLARGSGQDSERYFLLVVDDYTRYTTVFPLGSKGEIPDVLIP